MRILYLNACAEMGGSETSLAAMLESIRLTRPDWETHLLLAEGGPLAGRARDLGVHTRILAFPPALARLGDAGRGRYEAIASMLLAAGPSLRYARKLGAAVRAIQPDVIHSNGFKMHVLASMVGRGGVPLIWHIHDYIHTRPLMRRLLRQRRGRCTAAIANSRSVAAVTREVLAGLRVFPVLNAVNIDRFSPDGDQLDLDRLCGLPEAAPGTVRVGLLATFAKWKGHRVFLEALARLPIHLKVRGYIIGGPIYRTGGSQYSPGELKDAAQQLGLDGRVGFAGFQNDSARAIRSLDILVHASTQPEPFGMVIVEGMSCGKAVIASQAGGACELFTEEISALSHPPGDSATLAMQIVRLANDPGLRGRLGAAARASVRPAFTIERLGADLVSVYEQVGQRKGAMAASRMAGQSDLGAAAPVGISSEPRG